MDINKKVEIINVQQTMATTPATKGSHICEKHAMQQTLFCDESSCQELLCHTCVLVKHKEHNLKEIPEKAEQIRAELRELKTKTTNQKERFQKQLEKMNGIKEVVNSATSKAKDEVDKIQNETIKDLQKQIEEVKKEAQAEKEKLTANHEKQLKNIDLMCLEVEKRNTELGECENLISQFIEAEEGIDVILNHEIAKQIFTEVSANKGGKGLMESYEVMSFEPQGGTRLQRKPLGKIVTETKAIDDQNMEGSHGATVGAAVEAMQEAPVIREAPAPAPKPKPRPMPKPTTTNAVNYLDLAASQSDAGGAPVGADLEMPVRATEVKSWGAVGHLLSSSPTGKIYVGYGKQIQGFDIDGNKKVQINTSGNIHGLTCYHDKGADTLVVAMLEKIELRDSVTGIVLDSLSIPGFFPYQGICQDSQHTVIIGGKIQGQSNVIQCMIEHNKIKRTHKEINIPLSCINGLTSITHENKKYVIVTYCDSIMTAIINIDFDTGAVVWEKNNAMYNDRKIVPYGICTDGNSRLLLADCEGKRVLLLDMNGSIQSELVTDMSGNFCYHVSYISSLNKLIVTHDLAPYTYDIIVYDISTQTRAPDYQDLGASLGAFGGAPEAPAIPTPPVYRGIHSVATELQSWGSVPSRIGQQTSIVPTRKAPVRPQPPILQGVPSMATEAKSWGTVGQLLSSSPTGHIYVAYGNQIQAFDTNSNKKMHVTTTEKIHALTCHHANNRDTLVTAIKGATTIKGGIELRDSVTGNLLDTYHMDFHPYQGSCQDSPETVLIGGKIGRQTKVIQCVINNGKITKVLKQINIPLSNIDGLTSLIHHNKKYVIATDCGNKTVVAVDLYSGVIEWEIKNTQYNGKSVMPYGICTDGGKHLLLVDYNARRVLVVDMGGRIKSELVTNIRGNFSYNVSFIRSLHKLVLTHYHGCSNNVSVYDVKYNFFQ